ncbi:hypothetical protein DdX_10393 [Ditylenchus destructor]|uniref:Uncharacterized protein n=1 Tax=Ditylenchus destructor TaxID=166010 RepID=A0AAD4N0V4_9BILA|nr:hypothetical protein DdX_10393 [Ditylenchus destructor]
MVNKLGAAQKKAIARLWNQFCEFTSIPTFRFMTTNIAFFIRKGKVPFFEVCGGTQYAYINSMEVHEKLQGMHVKV